VQQLTDEHVHAVVHFLERGVEQPLLLLA